MPAKNSSSKRGAPPGNTNAQRHAVYRRHFSDDEIARIVEGITNPAAGLSAAIEATYVLLDRIIAKLGRQRDLDAYLRLVSAHNETTGRIAHLLRTHHLITAEAADSLAGHIAGVLDQLAEHLHADL